MNGAEVPVQRVAQLLDENVESLLEACVGAQAPPEREEAVNRVLHLLIGRYGAQKSVGGRKELGNSSGQPLATMLDGLDALEHAAAGLIVKQADPGLRTAMWRALEQMVDEVRAEYVKVVRSSERYPEDQTQAVAQFLAEHVDELLELCLGDRPTPARRNVMTHVLSLLLDRYTASEDGAFFEELTHTRRRPLAAMLDAMDCLCQAGIRLIMRRAGAGSRTVMWQSLEQMVDEVRGEYLQTLRASSERGAVIDLPSLEHLPGPLFTLPQNHKLEGINAAGRKMLEQAPERCHEAFFGEDQPCEGCPLPEVIDHFEHRYCPCNSDARQGRLIGLSPLSATSAIAHASFPYRPAAPGVAVGAATAETAVPPADGTGDAIGRSVLENIGSGVLFVDDGDRVVFSNHVADDVLGRSATGEQLALVVPDLSLVADDKQHRLKVRIGGGQERLLGYRCIRCTLDGVSGTVVSFRDIGEIERMRADMEKMKRLSEVGRMCAVVAHEIRNPLAGIKATIQSIEYEAAQAGLEQPMSIVKHEVERLGELLSSFFTFVRHRPPRRRMTHIKEVIDCANRGARPHMEGRTYEVSLADGLEPVWIDRDQMEQVLLNLLINAAQATPAEGRVCLVARPEGDQLRIEVSDTGCGISSQDLEKVFDAFYSTKVNGTGLGLSICYRIVNDHGGSVSVDSVPDEGTTFVIRLPMLQPA